MLSAVSILDLDADLVLPFYSSIFLYVFVAPISVFTVFMPIWDIHRHMVKGRQTYQDNLSKQVRELETIIYTHARENGNLEEAKIAKEKFEILKALEPTVQKYPVWPLRLSYTVVGLLSPQITNYHIDFAIKMVQESWPTIYGSVMVADNGSLLDQSS